MTAKNIVYENYIPVFLMLLILLCCFLAIQFVLSDEFSHMRQEERQQLLHVSKK